MNFNVRKHLIRVKGGQFYLPVSARLVWFREEHPEWSIETEPYLIDLDKRVAVFRSTVRDEQGRVIASATKMETGSDFGDFLEKAETGSVGRALAMCGYGTQFAPELMEGDFEHEGRVAYADTPLPHRSETARVAETPSEESMACAECGTLLKQSQYTVSMAKFKRPLCPTCQKSAGRAAPSDSIAATA